MLAPTDGDVLEFLPMGLNGSWTLAVGLLIAAGGGCQPGDSVNSVSDSDGGAEERLEDLGWFSDVTERSGLGFVHDPGAAGAYRMPEHIGSGGAFFDFNKDGLLDIYLVQNGGPNGPRNRLYRQDADGGFLDATAGSGLDVAGFGMGAAAADVNNDGWTDLLITEYGRVRLFLNLADGKRFEAIEVGLDNPRWAASAAFFDFDRDGWLDLVVGNYVDADPSHQCYDARGFPDYCGPAEAPPLITRLFHNRTSVDGKVAFEDVTVSAGLATRPGPALGVVCADFDGDRWPDIFLADDQSPNRLFMNQRDGTFVEQGINRGVAHDAMGRALANMGVGIGDVDGDGLFDLFITHLHSQPHNLWVQGPRGLFRDGTAGAGLMRSDWRGTGFGAAFHDLDLDGALDLVFVNGRIRRDHAFNNGAEPGGPPDWTAYAQRDQLFVNDGEGNFTDVSRQNPVFCESAATGRGLICGDYNNDGRIDLLVSNIGSEAKLYRGEGGDGAHWLIIRVVDDALGGRDAYGAEITVRAGEKRWWRLASPFYSYLASNDPRVHIGLGDIESVDSIEVVWPDGEVETFTGGKVNRLLVLRKGKS